MAEDAAWRDQVVASRPLLGRVATLITPKPVVGPPSQRVRAWTDGAAGEELLGGHLATLPDTVNILCTIGASPARRRTSTTSQSPPPECS